MLKLLFGVIVAVLVVSTCSDWSKERETNASKEKAATAAVDRKKAQEKAAMAAADREKAETNACKANRASLLAEYDSLTAAKRDWDAAAVIRTCSELTRDPELAAKIAAAEVRSHVATARDPKADTTARVRALDMLSRDHKDAYAGHEALYRQLQAKLQREHQAERAKELAERRKQGVRIGMSQEEVLQSSWGRPRSVNRTTYSWGVKEQWVYDGGYLYFTDGKLDAIQN